MSVINRKIKMRKYLILLLSLVLVNCTDCIKTKTFLNTERIELYYIPLSLLSPVGGLNEKTIIETQKSVINEKERIEKILELIKNLEPIDDSNYNSSNLYLRANFISENGEVKTLLFDKVTFKIGSCFYKDDGKLYDTITKGFYWDSKKE
jgi:hypothetical protein